jgi:hypothetical protein
MTWTARSEFSFRLRLGLGDCRIERNGGMRGELLDDLGGPHIATIAPTCFGPIDMRTQAEVPSALRSATLSATPS